MGVILTNHIPHYTGRLPDQNSRLIVLDIALEQSMAMIELLKLHIYREDHILFDLANEHLTEDVLAQIE